MNQETGNSLLPNREFQLWSRAEPGKKIFNVPDGLGRVNMETLGIEFITACAVSFGREHMLPYCKAGPIVSHVSRAPFGELLPIRRA